MKNMMCRLELYQNKTKASKKSQQVQEHSKS